MKQIDATDKIIVDLDNDALFIGEDVIIFIIKYLILT